MTTLAPRRNGSTVAFRHFFLDWRTGVALPLVILGAITVLTLGVFAILSTIHPNDGTVYSSLFTFLWWYFFAQGIVIGSRFTLIAPLVSLTRAALFRGAMMSTAAVAAIFALALAALAGLEHLTGGYGRQWYLVGTEVVWGGNPAVATLGVALAATTIFTFTFLLTMLKRRLSGASLAIGIVAVFIVVGFVTTGAGALAFLLGNSTTLGLGHWPAVGGLAAATLVFGGLSWLAVRRISY